MVDNIQLLQLASNLTTTTSSNCNCNSDNDAFNMVMINLLKAVAQSNTSLNNIKDLSVYDNNQSTNLETQNSVINTNKIQYNIENQSTDEKIESAIKESSKKYGVDEKLIRSIIKVESNFNPNCTSSAGAKGLMQLMPENCKYYNVTDPFDINQNIDAGTRHIKDYLDKYNGNVEMALMAYNGGPTRMANRGVKSIDDIYKMPSETQKYVPKVMKYYTA